MAIARQLPLPELPTSLDPVMRQTLQALFTRLGAWVTDTAKQLGQFQQAPVSATTPNPGQALVFDGTTWVPSNAGAFAGIFFNVPLVGTKDGLNMVFTSPFPLAVDSLGRPMATVEWKTGPQVYVTGVPAYGQWAYAAPDQITLGVPPDVGDILVFPMAVSS
jgi:hypothetical protein